MSRGTADSLAARPVVLLDAGGTLVGLDWDRVRALLAPLGLRPADEALVAAEARARVWADAAVRERLGLRGLWDGYFARLLADVGVPAERTAELAQRLWAMHTQRGLWNRPIDGALDAVRRLAAAGRRLAVVSNAEGQIEHDLQACGFGPYLETVVDSEIVGVAKPDPRIFAIALERLAARPEQAVYVGDVPSYDVAGARAAGIEPILVDPLDLHGDAGCARIRSIAELPALLGADGPVTGPGAPARPAR
ncbi:MAG: HAD family hydrolase [Acidobacteria bacterium]|nr:MAG: HAD family hydrolase [Acidobacteriota bacterium]